MHKNTMRFTILLLLSGFTLPAGVKAEDAVKEQTQNKLQVQDLAKNRLQPQEKLQTKEQLRFKTGGETAEQAGNGEKNALKEQERTRAMKGVKNSDKGLDRANETAGENDQEVWRMAGEKTENPGNEKVIKNQERSGNGDEKALKKQERKQEKKSLRERHRAEKTERREMRTEKRHELRSTGGKRK